jgi:hypothetical protein
MIRHPAAIALAEKILLAVGFANAPHLAPSLATMIELAVLVDEQDQRIARTEDEIKKLEAA